MRSCSAINPRLVYVAVTGWGESGPMAQGQATDNRIQAFAGFSSLNGAPGTSNEMYRHYTQLDGSTGNYITQAVLLALLARERTGRGQLVNISMLEAAVALQTSRLGEYLATGDQPQNLGSASSAIAPSEAFLCEEGVYLGIEARTEQQWRNLCDALGLQRPPGDPRFADNASPGAEPRGAAGDHRAPADHAAAAMVAVEAEQGGRAERKVHPIRRARQSPAAQGERLHPRDRYAAMGPSLRGWPALGLLSHARRSFTPRMPSVSIRRRSSMRSTISRRSPKPAWIESPGDDTRPPLTGYRVLELAQGISGPYAGVELADAGADVIKVEHVTGDVARTWQPRGANDLGAAFIQLNRGKRSVQLDLTSEFGKAAPAQPDRRQ